MKRRPNILLLMTDQQRFDTLGAAGAAWMRTPNLDRLVREGCLFENAHTPNPVCVPARHSLLTGTRERYHGIADNSMAAARLDGLPTIPRVLSDHGYFTAAVGKMHFSPPNRHHGFDEMHLMEEIPKHRRQDAYAEWLAAKGYADCRLLHGARPLAYHIPQGSVTDAAHHGSNFVADRTIETIERNDGRQPFFIFASWIHPHPPWNLPREWQGLYTGAELPDTIPGPRPAPLHETPSPWFGDDRPDLVRSIREAYFASISLADAAIGRVLDHLDRSGIAEDTLVLFTSDHGEMLGDHGLFQKMLPYEASVRVPFVLRFPGVVTPGARVGEFVDLLDIMPTFLDAVGIAAEKIRPPRAWEAAGASLLRTRDGGRDRSVQCSAYGSGSHRWVMARNRRFKFVRWAERGIEWFFDLENDPHERENLADSGRPPIDDYHDLRAKAVQYEKRWGDESALSESDFVCQDTTVLRDEMVNSLFPRWANQQRPAFGESGAEREADLFANQLARVLDEGPWRLPLSRSIPHPDWIGDFFEKYRRAGLTASAESSVRRSLGL